MRLIKLWWQESEEHILGIPMSANTAKLYDIPAHTQDLCSDDVVQFDHNAVITDVIERSGDRTRHGIFHFEGTHDEIQRRFKRIVGYMFQYGIICQHHEDHFLGMAVPSHVSDDQLKLYCEECRVLLQIRDADGELRDVSDLPPEDWPLTGTNKTDPEVW